MKNNKKRELKKLLTRKVRETMQKNKKSSERKKLLIVGKLAVLLIIIIFAIKINNNQGTMTYNEVIKAVENDAVAKIRVKGTEGKVSIIMKDGVKKTTQMIDNSEFINYISQKIEEEGSEVEIEIQKGINSEQASLLSTLIFSAILIQFILKRTQGGKFYIGECQSNKTFKDIAGIEEAQEQVEDIIDYLKDSEKYSRMGARMPKGVLLTGEPGNGKTLLAKAMSGEAGVAFFHVSGADFEERLVGIGASRVRELFAKAKRNAPAIIFVDEFDSIAQHRYSDASGRTSYSEQSLNQLLTEMDGFDENDRIIVIAATNHEEMLDKAVTRPGRFDRLVYISQPDLRARNAILKLHARNKKIASDIYFYDIAKKTYGFSGADLENVLNEAAISAVKKGKEYITKIDIEEAIDVVIAGFKKYSVMPNNEKHLTAVHEAGHAIVSIVVRPEVKNLGISIVPRSKAGGYNFFDESGKRYQKKTELFKQIQVLYGGRIAEEIILKDISTGAKSDMEKASQIAKKIVNEYGMNTTLLVKIASAHEYNKIIEEKSIAEAEAICQRAYNEAKEVVQQYQIQIEKLAAILEEKEQMTQEEIDKFISYDFNL